MATILILIIVFCVLALKIKRVKFWVISWNFRYFFRQIRSQKLRFLLFIIHFNLLSVSFVNWHKFGWRIFLRIIYFAKVLSAITIVTISTMSLIITNIVWALLICIFKTVFLLLDFIDFLKYTILIFIKTLFMNAYWLFGKDIL